MNLLQYIPDKEKRNAWLREFREWQQKPYEVAPLSEATHECSSCKTVFQGNYCPRCGQSAKIGRFSFNRAILHFLDVWGMGNRSMFRTIRDLMLRPGYMIRDYLSGMQSAYFPPFKMFFLLMAFSLLVEHGIDLSLDETDTQDAMPKVEQKDEEKPADDGITPREYTAAQGETMWDVSYRFGVEIDPLMRLNPDVKRPDIPLGGRAVRLC